MSRSFFNRPSSLGNRKCPAATSLLLLALTLAFFSPVARAQSTFGSFLGTIRDDSGAVLADCVVTLKNLGTSGERSTLSDKEGNYALVNIDPGTYQIKMLAPGFSPAVYDNLQLLSRQTVRIDGKMSVGTVVETVSATAAAAVITTEVSSIAETKTSRELQDLPVAIASRQSGST